LDPSDPLLEMNPEPGEKFSFSVLSFLF
jgi:hypothetical protein